MAKCVAGDSSFIIGTNLSLVNQSQLLGVAFLNMKEKAVKYRKAIEQYSHFCTRYIFVVSFSLSGDFE